MTTVVLRVAGSVRLLPFLILSCSHMDPIFNIARVLRIISIQGWVGWARCSGRLLKGHRDCMVIQLTAPRMLTPLPAALQAARRGLIHACEF